MIIHPFLLQLILERGKDLNKLLKKVVLTTASFVGLMGVGTLAANASTYTVKSGDSLWEIANDNGTTINSILTDNSNKLSSINSIIYPGEQLELNQVATQVSTNSSSYNAPQATYKPATNNYTSSNEQANTASNTGNNSYASSSDSVSSVAQEMQARTGVSASEWILVINRESGGNPTAQNPSSSAHGLFQQLGETSNNVQTQINDAVSLYNKQGLNAWSETR